MVALLLWSAFANADSLTANEWSAVLGAAYSPDASRSLSWQPAWTNGMTAHPAELAHAEALRPAGPFALPRVLAEAEAAAFANLGYDYTNLSCAVASPWFSCAESAGVTTSVHLIAVGVYTSRFLEVVALLTTQHSDTRCEWAWEYRLVQLRPGQPGARVVWMSSAVVSEWETDKRMEKNYGRGTCTKAPTP